MGFPVVSSAIPRPYGRRVRPLGWLLLAALACWFAAVEVTPYLSVQPASYRQYWNIRFWLMGHIGGAAVALLAGPIGLLGVVRRRYPRVHRWAGRSYVGGVAIGAPCALYLATQSRGGLPVTMLLGPLSVIWMAATALAFAAIRRRQLEAHREWMIRSYVLTFSFVVVRILLQTPLLAGAPFPVRLATLGWLSWTLPLFACEVALQWKRVWGEARVRALSTPPSASRPDRRVRPAVPAATRR